MKLNKKELKKIMYEFNTISNRLLQCAYEDYSSVCKKFFDFINNCPLIYDYIIGCGKCSQDMGKEFNEVSNGYGRFIFELGNNENEEVRNIYAILSHISENNLPIYTGIAQAYSHSNKFQEIIGDFNNRVTKILIMHIEKYLTKVGIDMGIDDNVNYIITNTNGQVIIATDNAVVNAKNTVSIDDVKLQEAIDNIKNAALSSGASKEDMEMINESLEEVKEELKNKKPKKGLIKSILSGLKDFKFTTEFTVAIASLVQMLQTANII